MKGDADPPLLIVDPEAEEELVEVGDNVAFDFAFWFFDLRSTKAETPGAEEKKEVIDDLFFLRSLPSSTLCDRVRGGLLPTISGPVCGLLGEDGLTLALLDKPQPPTKELKGEEGVTDGSLFSLKLSRSDGKDAEWKRFIVPRVRISSGVKERGLDFLFFDLPGLGGRLKGFSMLTVKERDCGVGECILLVEGCETGGDENAEGVGEAEVD